MHGAVGGRGEAWGGEHFLFLRRLRSPTNYEHVASRRPAARGGLTKHYSVGSLSRGPLFRRRKGGSSHLVSKNGPPRAWIRLVDRSNRWGRCAVGIVRPK